MRRGKSALSKRHSPRNGVEKRATFPLFTRLISIGAQNNLHCCWCCFFDRPKNQLWFFFLSLLFVNVAQTANSSIIVFDKLMCQYCSLFCDTKPIYSKWNFFRFDSMIAVDFPEIVCAGQKKVNRSFIS